MIKSGKSTPLASFWKERCTLNHHALLVMVDIFILFGYISSKTRIFRLLFCKHFFLDTQVILQQFCL